MKEPGKFLSRWSQRKRAAREKAPGPVDKLAGQEASAPSKEEADTARTPPAPTEAGVPAVDLSKLPPIESITATTDIRGFLAPGVPPDLTRAALRRAWVIDPKIKNFIEMAENQWDFTDPSTPGFGSLSGVDVRHLVRQIMGDEREQKPPESVPIQDPKDPTVAAVPPEDLSQLRRLPEPETEALDARPDEHAKVAAVQHKPPISEPAGKPIPRRRHGSALPE